MNKKYVTAFHNSMFGLKVAVSKGNVFHLGNFNLICTFKKYQTNTNDLTGRTLTTYCSIIQTKYMNVIYYLIIPNSFNFFKNYIFAVDTDN